MSAVYDSIMKGLNEAVEDSRSAETRLPRHTITVVPVKNFSPDEVKSIRKNTGLTQKLFAGYLGVSDKTVEAWEAGRNKPSGAASRLLTMMEMDGSLIERFPFVG